MSLTRRVSMIAAITLAGLVLPAQSGLAAAQLPPRTGQAEAVTPIARFLQKTMDQLKFQQVLDLAPPSSAQFRTLDSGVDEDASTPVQRTPWYTQKFAQLGQAIDQYEATHSG